MSIHTVGLFWQHVWTSHYPIFVVGWLVGLDWLSVSKGTYSSVGVTGRFMNTERWTIIPLQRCNGLVIRKYISTLNINKQRSAMLMSFSPAMQCESMLSVEYMSFLCLCCLVLSWDNVQLQQRFDIYLHRSNIYLQRSNIYLHRQAFLASQQRIVDFLLCRV